MKDAITVCATLQYPIFVFVCKGQYVHLKLGWISKKEEFDFLTFFTFVCQIPTKY